MKWTKHKFAKVINYVSYYVVTHILSKSSLSLTSSINTIVFLHVFIFVSSSDDCFVMLFLFIMFNHNSAVIFALSGNDYMN